MSPFITLLSFQYYQLMWKLLFLSECITILNYFLHNSKIKVYIFNSTYMEDDIEIQKTYINITNIYPVYAFYM